MKGYDLELDNEIYHLYPIMTNYKNNNSLAILLALNEDEWFCDLTVNLQTKPSSIKRAFVDTNNNPWAYEFIICNKLGKPTGNYGFSGFCSYPEFEFNLELLNENLLK